MLSRVGHAGYKSLLKNIDRENKSNLLRKNPIENLMIEIFSRDHQRGELMDPLSSSAGTS
jgi:hypothetical protein